MDRRIRTLHRRSNQLHLGTEYYHNLAIWYGGSGDAPLALPAYIDAAAASPFGEGLWVSVMLLSTLFPTVLHGLMALAGAFALFTPVTAARLTLAGDLERLDQLEELQKSSPCSAPAGILRRPGLVSGRLRQSFS